MNIVHECISTTYPDLSIFKAVAEERSFTRAAVQFGISQSALSHRMRRLETRLGVRLLIVRREMWLRRRQGSACSLRFISPAIAEINGELTSLNELRNTPSGTIRFTTSKHAALTVLWPKLAKLLPNYPDVHVELSLDSGFADVVSDRFDAGVRLGEAIAKDMVAVKISPDLQMAVVGAPSYSSAILCRKRRRIWPNTVASTKDE